MSKPGGQNVRAALAVLLRQCADYLEGLPDSEIDALIAGEVELRLSIGGRKPSQGKKSLPRLDAARLDELAIQLRGLQSRDEGERLLKNAISTKVALELLAKRIDVPARREDRLEDLRRRIIDATIGFRLGSAAIQGPHARRDRPDGSSPMPQSTSR